MPHRTNSKYQNASFFELRIIRVPKTFETLRIKKIRPDCQVKIPRYCSGDLFYLIAILRDFGGAIAFFGKSIVKTPFLNFASILSSAMLSGKRTEREKVP